MAQKTKLFNHEVEQKNVYKLHYISHYILDRGYGCKISGVMDESMRLFEIPEELEAKEAFIIFSFLIDLIEKQFDFRKNSLPSVIMLDRILDKKELGFERVTKKQSERDITDLFVVDGDLKKIKESDYYSKYFNWYTPNVTPEEVKSIYESMNKNFVLPFSRCLKRK